MERYYINGIGCVSAQNTIDSKIRFQDLEALTTNVSFVKKPDYKKYINPTMIRRMAVGVKIGVVASSVALQEAELKIPDAIITGTGMGCLRDSEKFMKTLIDNDEQFLTPTAFIQSTHNTVGAQIALGLGCKAYNVTYVHDATSFETSLIDAMMMLNEGEKNVLVGGVDEIGDHTVALHKLVNFIKKEEQFTKPILTLKTKGAAYSEGANFFVLETDKKNNSYAELVAVETYNVLSENKISEKLESFLNTNNLTISEIDTVVLGLNGDIEYDSFYTNLQNNLLKNTSQIYYKHFSGEYNTASAFGMWVACQVIKNQEIPESVAINTIAKSEIKNVLLYNQYRGKNHGFILLKSC